MRALFVFAVLLLPHLALAASGQDAFLQLKRCVMENDTTICHAAMTPASYGLFDRFASYNLMPCLPTDFSYQSEEVTPDGHVMVVLTMPAGGGRRFLLRLLYAQQTDGLKLDVPATLHRDLGENWQNKIQLSEQLFLMMKQNMGNKLTCDQLNALVVKK